MEGRPKSLVRILLPDDNGESGNGEDRRAESPRSIVSRSFSAVTHSTLSNLRYQLFGSRSLKTPDYFRKDGVSRLEGILLVPYFAYIMVADNMVMLSYHLMNECSK